MKQIKQVGNYLQCPYCLKLYGNGISVVYTNIVESCTCEGMREAVRVMGMETDLEFLRKQMPKN